eukprot:942492-Pleurochrysis_carterae.AAC.1
MWLLEIARTRGAARRHPVGSACSSAPRKCGVSGTCIRWGTFASGSLMQTVDSGHGMYHRMPRLLLYKYRQM